MHNQTALINIILPHYFASIIRIILCIILFFTLLHIFLKLVFPVGLISKSMGLMDSWFNPELCTIVFIILLCVLFTNFIMMNFISIQSEEFSNATSSSLNSILNH
jgi:hypothetical protein